MVKGRIISGIRVMVYVKIAEILLGKLILEIICVVVVAGYFTLLIVYTSQITWVIIFTLSARY